MATATLALIACLTTAIRAQSRPWSDVSPTWGTASAIAVDPSQPDRVYAVVGPDLWTSSDGGASWAPTAPIPYDQPQRSIFGIAAARSAVYALSEARGASYACFRGLGLCDVHLRVLKSADGGVTWSDLHDDATQVFQYTSPNRFLTVASDQTETVFAGTRTGLLKSSDGGATWTTGGAGLPVEAGAETLVVDPHAPSTVYVTKPTNVAGPGGVFRSIDGGISFSPSSQGLTGDSSDIHALAVDPATPGTLYAATTAGIMRSTDSGDSWQPYEAPLTDVRALAIHPSRPGRWYAGTAHGLFVSSDSGAAWQLAGGLERYEAQLDVRALAIAPGATDVAYAGNTPFCVVRTSDAGNTWHLNRRGGCHPFSVQHVIADPVEPGVLLAASPTGFVYRTDDRGETWTPFDTGLATLDALAVDPRTSLTYAVDGPSLARSSDSGRHWERISDSFSGLAESRTMVFGEARIWAHGPLGVTISDDGGATWRDNFDFYTPPLAGYFFAADSSSPGRFYAQFRDGAVARTLDGGFRWEFSDAGIVFPYAQLTALVLDPRQPQRLYASLLDGGGLMYTSADGAGFWSVVPAPNLFIGLRVNPVTSEVYAVAQESHDSPLQVWVGPEGATGWRRLGAPVDSVRSPVVDPHAQSLYLYGTGIRRLRIGQCDPATDPGCERLTGRIRARFRARKSTLVVRTRVQLADTSAGLGIDAAAGPLDLREQWALTDCRARGRRSTVCEKDGQWLRLRALGGIEFELRTRLRVAAGTDVVPPLTLVITELASGVEHGATLTACRRRGGLVCRTGTDRP